MPRPLTTQEMLRGSIVHTQAYLDALPRWAWFRRWIAQHRLRSLCQSLLSEIRNERK